MATTSTAITANAAQFPTELVREMFDAVKGHSSLAKLSAQKPIPFSGTTQMVFNMEGEASIVGEGTAKPAGNGTVTPVVIRPLKFVYQMRVSDEFMHCGDEKRLEYWKAFAAGFSKKIARGIDIAAMHGVNPADGETVASLSANNFEGVIPSANVVSYVAASADDNLSEAITKLDGTAVTGMALAPTFGAAMGAIKEGKNFLYPEYAFGGNPERFAGHRSDINNTVNFGASTMMAIVGDFENAFRWGYAGEIPVEVIAYGDPDGAKRDLKQYNEVCLRAEAYVGWGILDKTAFAAVKNQ